LPLPSKCWQLAAIEFAVDNRDVSAVDMRRLRWRCRRGMRELDMLLLAYVAVRQGDAVGFMAFGGTRRW